MGAWGTGFFEDDIALDWLAELEIEGPQLVVRTLANVGDVSPHSYLDAAEASEALAAAAIAAGSLSAEYHHMLPEEAKQWLAANKFDDPHAVVFYARTALWRILSDNSELRDCWQESDHFDEWYAAVSRLMEFVKQETEELGRGISDEDLEQRRQSLKLIRETEYYVVYDGYIEFYEDLWGPGIFEHRDALEYLCFTEDKSPRALLDKIKSVATFRTDEWLLMTDAGEALVAMALLTATENPGYWLTLPPEGRKLISKFDYLITKEDRQLCARCLERIFRHKSEWLDVWEDSPDFGNARLAVFEMARGLGITNIDGDVAEGARFVVFDKPVQPALPRQPVYVPLRRLASLVQALSVLISLVMLATMALDISDLITVSNPGFTVSPTPLLQDSIVSQGLNWTWACAYVALWVCFPLLIRRAHANLPALAAYGTRYPPAGAFFSTLVPWIGWFGHFTAVHDAVKASHPQVVPGDPLAWQRSGLYWPVIPFWMGWAYLVVIRLGIAVAGFDTDSADIQLDFALSLGTSLLMIVLMTMVILITRELVRRQAARRQAVEIVAGELGLTADDYTVVLLSNFREFGSQYRQQPAPAPAQRRDNLRSEKWSFLGLTLAFIAGLSIYTFTAGIPQDGVVSSIFTVVIGTVYLFAAWRVFFGGVRNEKRGCIWLTALCMLAVLSLLFGFEMYREPAGLAWYASAFVMHVWLLTITVRDARRWSSKQ